ncbi:MAG: uroporphyrinogen-III synthase [Campylobacteraceae bacterium]|nr:uroporphyrinogen-III synthase [Campylobacteraceae bacterium]
MIYLFSDKAYEGVENLPLIEIVFYDKLFSLEHFDAIIFTSKNSVEALERVTDAWQKIDAYAIAEGTAHYIQSKKGKIVYTSATSYGDDFAHHIIPLLRGKKVLFPRAKEVVTHLYEILTKEGILVEEEIVYETTCKAYGKDKAPPKNAKLIFTSPSTVQCFLSNFEWDESYTAIAIGHKTAQALPLHVKRIVSEKQSITHCITLAKQLN